MIDILKIGKFKRDDVIVFLLYEIDEVLIFIFISVYEEFLFWVLESSLLSISWKNETK